MTLCLNPVCPRPENPDQGLYCQACGSPLQLGDRYRALRLIGQGGFGRTFLAVDSALDQAGVSPDRTSPDRTSPDRTLTYCVIKQLLGSADAGDRFQQEVERLAQLGEHPQIPRLLAHFVNSIGQYLVQAWIEGDNLETLLAEQGPFNETQVRQLLADILPVLRFVHQHQVIHRDLKPANLILQRQTQRYVLVDFGAAKAISPQGAETGTTIGSAGYVAPEQSMGKAIFASDLYSLGVTCIHLLTGLHPFDLYSVSEDRWIWRQYLTQPVSLELRKVLDKLLQRPTSQRYASATQVLQALRLEAATPAMASLPLAATAATASSSERAAENARPIAVSSAANPAAKPRSPDRRSATADWRCLRTTTAHQAEVSALAVSPNGRLLASGGADKTIQLWAVESAELLYRWTGRSLLSPVGHRDRITALTFSPNSRVLISASTDGTIQQWDLQTGQQFSELPGQGWGIGAIALSPKEPLLVSGGSDGLIQLWDLEAEKLIANLVQLAEPITALQIDPAGQSLWSSSGKPICQWDLQTDRLIATLAGHVTGVTALALDSQHCTLISGGRDRLIKLWNLNSRQQQKLIAAHSAPVQALAVHPHRPQFASASADGSIKLWDLWTGDRLTTLRHAWGINTLQFAAQGDWLISGSVDGTLQFWQPVDASNVR